MDIKKLSELARLALSKDEENALSGELEAILGYVEKLKGVDTEGVPEMTHSLDVCNVFRDDVPAETPYPEPDKLIEAATEKRNGFVKVKNVFDGRD